MSALGLAAAMSPALSILPAEAAIPKKGGRFRVGVPAGATTDYLDPVNMHGVMKTFIGFPDISTQTRGFSDRSLYAIQ